MRTRFLSTASNFEHLFFLTSSHSIRRYHRLRRNQLRLQIRQLEALFDEAQVSEALHNYDANESLGM